MPSTSHEAMITAASPPSVSELAGTTVYANSTTIGARKWK